MSRTAWIIFASLGLVGTARADVSEPTLELLPAPPPELRLSSLPPSLTEPIDVTPTTSYRAVTMTVDAIAIAALLGSFATQGKPGPDNGLSLSLFAIGSLGGVYAVPIIHGTRGHGARGFASWLLREGTVTAGVAVALGTASCKPEVLICGLDRVGPGATAGLIVASVIDAVFLSGETEQRPTAGTAWSPLLAPARGGGTVGLATAF
jgi:hypothetical protein